MSNFFSKTNRDISLVFKKKSTLNKKMQKRRRRGFGAILGLILVLIQLVATVLFSLELIKLNVLPMNYLIGLIVILGLLVLYDFTAQFNRAHILGKFLSVFMTAVMVLGFLAGGKINSTFSKITGETITSSEVIDIVVLADDKAASVGDTLNYSYGYNSNIEGNSIKKALSQIESSYSCTLASHGYSNWDDVINKLYENKEIKAIAVSSSIKASLIMKHLA